MTQGTPVLSSPRAVLAVLCALFTVTAVASWSYPPDYLHLPRLWAALAAVAAVASLMSLSKPGRKRVVVAGAAAIGAAAARSAAIFVQLAVDSPDEPQNWSFILAAGTWAAVAVLVHSLWHHSIIPWAAMQRAR
jgi:hypothetical protein